jgi:hypothetical protein
MRPNVIQITQCRPPAGYCDQSATGTAQFDDRLIFDTMRGFFV